MTTVELLEKAKKKIEKGWCQETLAKDAKGRIVSERSRDACQWCSVGAILAALPIKEWRKEQEIGFSTLAETMEGFLEKAMGSVSVAHWNDRPGRTQQQVIAAFDKAIAAAKKKETR